MRYIRPPLPDTRWKTHFHGNNKTDADIRFAMDKGVGCFVVDNEEELKAVDEEAASRGITQKIMLRLTPGIDPHTYEAISTGKVDSMFGVAIETGQAETFTASALGMKHIELRGFHCQVGSQVFAENVFERAAVIMLRFIAHIKDEYGYQAQELDLGGMTDDPRYALYCAQYTCLAAKQTGNTEMMHCSLVGRCCESGDIIQADILLPADIKRGDIVAVCTTGAYNYSMASNYNRVPRPPIVMLSGGESYIAVRRESLEDICLNDL